MDNSRFGFTRVNDFRDDNRHIITEFAPTNVISTDAVAGVRLGSNVSSIKTDISLTVFSDAEEEDATYATGAELIACKIPVDNDDVKVSTQFGNAKRPRELSDKVLRLAPRNVTSEKLLHFHSIFQLDDGS
jgi:hypothetical protein